MRRDDRTIHGMTRRAALGALGASGGAAVAWWALGPGVSTPAAAQAPVPGCVVRPEQTEGPYFVDANLDRADIRSAPSTGAMHAGVPLDLTFTVAQLAGGACGVLAGAVVDVWQCDALGAYSQAGDPFLRGLQRTDTRGVARFTTIYPGWYQGRAVHIHFKVRTLVSGQPWEFTSQLYFDDALTDRVHALTPYSARGARDTRNGSDGIFRGGGSELLLDVRDAGAGYAASFDLGLDLSDAAVGQPDREGGGRGGRGRAGGGF